jgi:hypothetical protein
MDKNSSRPNCGKGGQHKVHSDAVPDALFSWELADKVQCVTGTEYPVQLESAPAKYFTGYVKTALLEAEKLVSSSDWERSALLATAATRLCSCTVDDVLRMHFIKYGQLSVIRDPPQREDHDLNYVPETWENYQCNTGDRVFHAVQAPDGTHYEVRNQRAWPHTVEIVCHMDLDDWWQDKDGNTASDVSYACKLFLAKRTKHHLYNPTHKPHDAVIVVQLGEINQSTGNFVAWPIAEGDRVCVADAALQSSLFNQFNARGEHWPRYEGDEPQGEDVPVLRQRWELHEQDFQMVLFEEEGSFTPVCNFVLLRLDALLQFCEDVGVPPYYRVICRALVDEHNEGSFYLSAQDKNRSPRVDHLHHVDVEVLVQSGELRSNADVARLFQNSYARLSTSVMTPDMLRCWLCAQKQPPVTSCIVRFGRQQSGDWVSANLQFKGRVLKPLDSYTMIPLHFYQHKIESHAWPKHVIIPQCHVRYIVGVNFWTHTLPQMFQNNEMSARAVFAHAVMGLYAQNLWQGQAGVGHGAPFCWAYSPEPSTGKSEAQYAAYSMLGFDERKPVSGASTLAQVWENIHWFSNLTLQVEDYVPKKDAEENIHALMVLGRALYDRTSKVDFKKTRYPYSTVCWSVSTAPT